MFVSRVTAVRMARPSQFAVRGVAGRDYGMQLGTVGTYSLLVRQTEGPRTSTHPPAVSVHAPLTQAAGE